MPNRKRVFISQTGRWYTTLDKQGRLSIPKIFTSFDFTKGYRISQIDDRRISLEPDSKFPVLSQLTIPHTIRKSMKLADGTILQIKPNENGEGFTLIVFKEDEIE